MEDQPESSGIFYHIDKLLIWISLIGGGAALIFMTAFSVWNVLVMRKALNAPIVGAEDVLILVLVLVVALSIPLGARTGAHIEIEVLENRMSAAFAKWSLILVKLLGVALLLTMAWRTWHAGQSASRFGETTQQLLISYEPFYYVLAVSVALYALVLLIDIWQLLRNRRIPKIRLNGDAL